MRADIGIHGDEPIGLADLDGGASEVKLINTTTTHSENVAWKTSNNSTQLKKNSEICKKKPLRCLFAPEGNTEDSNLL